MTKEEKDFILDLKSRGYLRTNIIKEVMVEFDLIHSQAYYRVLKVLGR